MIDLGHGLLPLCLKVKPLGIHRHDHRHQIMADDRIIEAAKTAIGRDLAYLDRHGAAKTCLPGTVERPERIPVEHQPGLEFRHDIEIAGFQPALAALFRDEFGPLGG